MVDHTTIVSYTQQAENDVPARDLFGGFETLVVDGLEHRDRYTLLIDLTHAPIPGSCVIYRKDSWVRRQGRRGAGDPELGTLPELARTLNTASVIIAQKEFGSVNAALITGKYEPPVLAKLVAGSLFRAGLGPTQ